MVNTEIDLDYRKIGNFRFLFGSQQFQDPETEFRATVLGMLEHLRG